MVPDNGTDTMRVCGVLPAHCDNGATAELGSTGKFRGPDVIPDDGANAMRMCSVQLACCDDKAVPLLSCAVLASSEACMWSLTVVLMPAHVRYTACTS